MTVRRLSDFDPDQIFTSGQTFRFKKLADGSWSGVYKDVSLRLKTEGDETTFFCDENAFSSHAHYLDLDFDYGALKAL